MSKLRAEEVFKPGTFPEYTYISRESSEFSFSYELRLEQALRTPGYLTSIVGPSKTGKTVLCEKVIGIDRIVDLSGNDFRKNVDFWETISKKVGLPIEGELSSTKTVNDQIDSKTNVEKTTTSKDRFLSGKDVIINYFKENNLVLVIDDFHYASTELQFEIAYQLKDAIRKEFKAIIISLPHRADDAIRKNSDLSGRLSLINIDPWEKDELKSIAITGFRKLEVEVTDKLVELLAIESLTSPHLMQSICLSLSLLSKIDKTGQIDYAKYEDGLRFTSVNLPYKDVYNKLRSGPSTRGQKRKLYKLNIEEELDVYGVILKALSVDPPQISIPIDELKSRVDGLMTKTEGKIDKNKIKNTLKFVQTIMDESESIYQVFEWKDDQIYIIEPLFLFYARWGVHTDGV